MRMINASFGSGAATPLGQGFAMPGAGPPGPFDGFGGPFAGGFGGWPPGGAAGGDDPIASYNEALDGDISDDASAPTDLGTLEIGTSTVTATQQGEPRDVDYVTFTVPKGTELTSLVIEGYTAEPANLAFFGIEEGSTFTTDPATQDASTLLGGVTYAHWAVGVDVLQIAGDLEGAQGFDGVLGAGEYTLWLNQTGPASTVSIGLELTEVGGAPEDDPAGDAPAGLPSKPEGFWSGFFENGHCAARMLSGRGPDGFDFHPIPEGLQGGMVPHDAIDLGGIPDDIGRGMPPGGGTDDGSEIPDAAFALLPEDVFMV